MSALWDNHSLITYHHTPLSNQSLNISVCLNISKVFLFKQFLPSIHNGPSTPKCFFPFPYQKAKQIPLPLPGFLHDNKMAAAVPDVIPTCSHPEGKLLCMEQTCIRLYHSQSTASVPKPGIPTEPSPGHESESSFNTSKFFKKALNFTPIERKGATLVFHKVDYPSFP